MTSKQHSKGEMKSVLVETGGEKQLPEAVSTVWRPNCKETRTERPGLWNVQCHPMDAPRKTAAHSSGNGPLWGCVSRSTAEGSRRRASRMSSRAMPSRRQQDVTDSAQTPPCAEGRVRVSWKDNVLAAGLQ